MIKKLYLVLVLGITLFGCSKPEDGPLEKITEDYVFDPKDPNGFYTEEFLNNIYSILPNGFNRIDGHFLDAATDDAIPVQAGTQIERFTNGFLNASNNPDDAWDDNYEGIRKVNSFLQKIDIVPVPAKIPHWKAEARFLRAMFYFELVKRYGGVPLLGDVVYNAEDVHNFSRNAFEDCIDYIVSECDAIEAKVYTDPVSTSDYGRISNGIVLALKAKALLYAASPLYNGGNTGVTAAEKENQGYPAYDAERWNKAAIAADDLIKKGKFSLLSPAQYKTNNVFLVRRNTEVIFAYLVSDNRTLETNNGPVGYGNPNNANGRTNPTQNLVDAFPDAGGRPLSESTIYDPQDPYANRDPRLVQTVLYNGAQWLKRPVETFDGGLDNPGRNTAETRTGYYLRKFLGNFETLTAYNNQRHNYPIFRYSDILLSYAEAKNEYLTAPDASVYKVLYDLRQRAGIAKGSVPGYSYGLKEVMTKEEMREAVRNERRIELAFEEHRFWDLRRWKVAETQLNGPLYGMRITKDGTGAFTYAKEQVSEINFESRLYFYPIPFNEILRNSNLIQNTGW